MSYLWNILPVILLIGFVTGSVPFSKNNDISSKINDKSDDTVYRLPVKNVTPLNYDIKLVPDIRNFIFTGETTITVRSAIDITEITLHAKNLTIDETSTTLTIDSKNNVIIKPQKHLFDTTTDFLTLQFSTAVSPNNNTWTLYFKYNGTLMHDDLNGFYRSSYLNARGEKVWLATTQFEPTHARRAFPCFDEPALKATFKISINHYTNYTAVSNMPIEYTIPDSNNFAKQWTYFKVTPIMSTYLVAFVISDFKSLISEDGKFRIWSKPDDIYKGYYALEIGEKTLKALDTYTGISHYSIVNKMDNFAIPDFRAGAMENWGIVTYKESALLYEEGVTSTIQKQSIATIISHEFAHQWFGNLVSPDWWSALWLNEGFANYFQHVITDQIEQSWRLMDQFVVKNLQETAFIADDKEDAHAMNGVNVDSPSNISKFFDSITYSKAGSVIRMIAHSINETQFKIQIKSYLSKNKFKAVGSESLFTELTTGVTSAGLSDGELMKAFVTWASQPGYPVITVIRNYTTGAAVISQHRFMTTKGKDHKESWIVPINYAMESDLKFADTKPLQWLKAGANTTITGLRNNEWVIFNIQQTGYYRVNYDEDNWMRIIRHLRNSSTYEEIHVLNRAQLLDDSFNLAQAGELADYSVFLDASTYLENEVDYIPWHAAFRAFGTLSKALANSDEHALLKVYIRRLISKLEDNVGFNETNNDHIMKLNRVAALKWACNVGSEKCDSKAQEKLLDHIRGPNKLSPDLRGVLLCAGIRKANVTIWNEMFSLYEKIKNVNERNDILSAFGCSTDSKILNSFLDKSIAENSELSTVKAIESVVAGSLSGVDIAFDFINKNLEEIIKINENKTESVTKILNDIGSKMTTKNQIDKLQIFIDTHESLGKNLKDNALVSANKNIQWIGKFGPSIGTFLKEQLAVPTPKPEINGSNTSFRISTQLTLVGLIASLISRVY